MRLILAVDFGSTFTKVVAFDLDHEGVVGLARAPSTVDTDVNVGLQQALDQLSIHRQPVANLPVEHILACSSAAGGLKVVVIGLVPVLTVEAARQAALGAGAKIVGSFAFKLGEADLQLVAQSHCDIVLLAGGTNGGDEETILHNARLLASSNLDVPIIVAGNRLAGSRGQDILQEKGKLALLTENLLPDLDTLNTVPVQQVIRDLFMSHIIHAKGIDRAQKYVSGGIIPTPSAVLKAVQLLAQGTDEEPGLGELVTADVGGATTDVHSVCSGAPTGGGVVLKGLPEPHVKRTVEGDLGLRSNAATLLEQGGEEKLRSYATALEAGFDLNIKGYIQRISGDTRYIPATVDEFALDAALGRMAVELAMERHAGTLKQVSTAMGVVQVQYGKDLTGVNTLIGIGGIFAYGRHPWTVLEGSLFNSRDPFSLRMKSPICYLDKAYILYAVGLLADLEPSKALRIGKNNLQRA